MEIRLYNTRSRKVESFKPLQEGRVKIYSCGPTVYNYAHIGNLRAFLFADVLKRMFRYFDYEVYDVLNITDVGHLTSDADEGEDKMLKGAKREKKTVWDVAKFYTNAFLEDCDKLNIIPTKQLPRATEHINEIIQVIKKLEERGYTYQEGGNVYFDTSKFPSYEKFAKLPKKTQGRVEKDRNKKNERDFVLWFTKSKFDDQEMKWDSPFGKGYPGWHIECSAMSWKYLGEEFDIHTGGEDHIPVHHTNEIAQSECAFGKAPWVNYWMHSAFLTIKDGKMAKSGDNFLTLKRLEEEGYSPEHFRYFTLTAHYKFQLAFSYEALEGAKNSYEKLKRRVLELKGSEKVKESNEKEAKEFKKKFEAAISNDLNMPNALAVMWSVLDSSIGDGTKYELLKSFDCVFGLGLSKLEKDAIPKEVTKLAEERETARANKDFSKSDELRDEILRRGFVVEDSDEGFVLRKK